MEAAISKETIAQFVDEAVTYYHLLLNDNETYTEARRKAAEQIDLQVEELRDQAYEALGEAYLKTREA